MTGGGVTSNVNQKIQLDEYSAALSQLFFLQNLPLLVQRSAFRWLEHEKKWLLACANKNAAGL